MASSTWPCSRVPSPVCWTTTTYQKRPISSRRRARSAVLVYENTWAGPFVTAMRNAGAEVMASGRIPVEAVIAALDTLESAKA